MTTTVDPENTPLPGTVFTPRQVRVLKIAVIVMGVLLAGGFAFVMAAIVYQASKLGETKEVPSPVPALTAAAQGSALVLPKGGTIESMALDGDRLAVHLASPEGGEIAIVDATTGQVLSRIKIEAR